MEKNTDRALLKKLGNILTWFGKMWFKFLNGLILLSLFVLFLFSFLYDKNITIQTMNSWVGLILGIVATILSIISTVVSFYNLERTNEINEENIKTMQKLEENIQGTYRSAEKNLTFIDEINKELQRTLKQTMRNNKKTSLLLEKLKEEIGELPLKTAKEVELSLQKKTNVQHVNINKSDDIEDFDLPF